MAHVISSEVTPIDISGPTLKAMAESCVPEVKRRVIISAIDELEI